MTGNDVESPLISIIIPHWRGEEILLRGLNHLQKIRYQPIEILLIDNGCDDGSIRIAGQRFPDLKILKTGSNLGFAGACNLGLKTAKGKYAALLNNDAVVTSEWLNPLVQVMERDPLVAACQPKILSLDSPEKFDYAGAAGGFLDVLGYPFCRGRIFSTLEPDRHQYDDEADIFWASGACCLLRMSTLSEIGLLDEQFFAHMEEIDLNWRMHLAGYRVVAVPSSVVYHQAGSTLHASSPRKTYLNHRNGLLILLKNYSPARLLAFLPVRFLLDVVEALRSLLSLRWLHALMVLRAHFHILTHLPRILHQRRQSRSLRRIPDATIQAKFYRRSIVWDYFVRGRKYFRNLGSAENCN